METESEGRQLNARRTKDENVEEGRVKKREIKEGKTMDTEQEGEGRKGK